MQKLFVCAVLLSALRFDSAAQEKPAKEKSQQTVTVAEMVKFDRDWKKQIQDALGNQPRLDEINKEMPKEFNKRFDGKTMTVTASIRGVSLVKRSPKANPRLSGKYQIGLHWPMQNLPYVLTSQPTGELRHGQTIEATGTIYCLGGGPNFVLVDSTFKITKAK